MPRAKKVSTRKTTSRQVSSARVSRGRTAAARDKAEVREEREERNEGWFDKMQYDLQHNQSYLNLILGGLIIVVLGVLIFNYFNKPEGNLGPSQESQASVQPSGDVAKESLPGKYTVKAGDTLYSIAQKYYDNGYQYTKIMQENNISNENILSEGQVLEIPRLAEASASPTSEELAAASSSPAPPASDGTLLSPEASTNPSDLALQQSSQPANQQPNQPAMNQANTAQNVDSTGSTGTGGAENQTIWGEKITGTTYTVQAGDWLSKIAGRAYGDVYQYDKIAKANNIANPDSIEVGTVLQIPR